MPFLPQQPSGVTSATAAAAAAPSAPLSKASLQDTPCSPLRKATSCADGRRHDSDRGGRVSYSGPLARTSTAQQWGEARTTDSAGLTSSEAVTPLQLNTHPSVVFGPEASQAFLFPKNKIPVRGCCTRCCCAAFALQGVGAADELPGQYQMLRCAQPCLGSRREPIQSADSPSKEDVTRPLGGGGCCSWADMRPSSSPLFKTYG